MSEFSMMTQEIPWPVAYAGFILAMVMVGWATYVALGYFDRKKAKEGIEGERKRRMLFGLSKEKESEET